MSETNPWEVCASYFDRLCSIVDNEDVAERPAAFQSLLDEIDQHLLVAQATGDEDARDAYRQARRYVEARI